MQSQTEEGKELDSFPFVAKGKTGAGAGDKSASRSGASSQDYGTLHSVGLNSVASEEESLSLILQQGGYQSNEFDDHRGGAEEINDKSGTKSVITKGKGSGACVGMMVMICVAVLLLSCAGVMWVNLNRAIEDLRAEIDGQSIFNASDRSPVGILDLSMVNNIIDQRLDKLRQEAAEKVDSLQAKLEQSVQEQNVKVAALNAVIEQQKEQLEQETLALDMAVKALKMTSDGLQKAANTEDARVATLSSNLEEEEKKLKQEALARDASVKALEMAADNLRAEVEQSLKREKDEVGALGSAMERESEKLEENTLDLKSAAKELQNAADGLQAQIEHALQKEDGKIADLNAALNQQKDNLHQESEAREAAIKEVQAANDRLTSNLNALKESVAALAQEKPPKQAPAETTPQTHQQEPSTHQQEPSFTKYPAGSRASCPEGLVVPTVEECGQAGAVVGGQFVDGHEVRVDSWEGHACGCFMENGYVYFNLANACSAHSLDHPVCRQ